MTSIWNVKYLLLLLWVSLKAIPVFSQQSLDRFIIQKLPISKNDKQTYSLVYLPSDYKDSIIKKYPVIIFLHGAGECGDGIPGLSKLLNTGLPKILSNGFEPQAYNMQDKKNYKFIVIAPQAPTASHWSYSYPHLKFMLPALIKLYRIDTTRIYLTGVSAGGGGIWSSVTNDETFSKKIAAIVPISSTGVNVPKNEYVKIPLVIHKYGVGVWLISGSNDHLKNLNLEYINLVNRHLSQDTFAKLTLVRNEGHTKSFWDKVYDFSWKNNDFNMNIYEWMLTNKR